MKRASMEKVMLKTIEAHADGEYRLFKADLRRRKRVAGGPEHAVEPSPI
jgi:hypothetical protein